MLDRNAHLHFVGPRGVAAAPRRFMDFDAVVDTLVGLDAKWILFEGEEASLDPQMPRLAETLHRKLGSTNVLLTNAFKMPDLTHIDKIAVGLKAFNEQLHLEYTGQSNKTILENFKRIHATGIPMMAETLLIPGCIEKEEIEQIAKFIASVDKNIRYQVDAYSKVADNPWPRPTAEQVEEAVMMARKHLANVHFFKGTEERDFGVKSIFPTEAELDAPELQPAIETRELITA
jgi:pyruvate-formate lyase-activating enzyme